MKPGREKAGQPAPEDAMAALEDEETAAMAGVLELLEKGGVKASVTQVSEEAVTASRHLAAVFAELGYAAEPAVSVSGGQPGIAFSAFEAERLRQALTRPARPRRRVVVTVADPHDRPAGSFTAGTREVELDATSWQVLPASSPVPPALYGALRVLKGGKAVAEFRTASWHAVRFADVQEGT